MEKKFASKKKCDQKGKKDVFNWKLSEFWKAGKAAVADAVAAKKSAAETIFICKKLNK